MLRTDEKRRVGARTVALKHPEESKSSRASGTNERDHRQHLAKSDYTAVSDYSGYGRTEPDSGLTGLTIAYDQLTLTLGYWEQDIDDTDTSRDARRLTGTN